MSRPAGITQTTISFKCESENLKKLDELCEKLGCKRNKMLNFLVDYAIKQLNNPKDLLLTSIYSTIKF